MTAPAPTLSDDNGAASRSAPHVPVMRDEAIAALRPARDELIVDATFGAGGYTRALLDLGARVHAFDRDPDAIARARDWPEAVGTAGAGASAVAPPLTLHNRPFSHMAEALGELGISRVDGVVMDLGVSSMQLDSAERGFAFSADGPLDMRMSRKGPSAADFLNSAREEEIADVLYRYGDERKSRRIARAIVAARPLRTTGDLARVVRKALGPRAGEGKDPATRSFQAIRIHINREIDELIDGLHAAETLLKPGGRLVVVSFHSLEDRVVKRFLREAEAREASSRHRPQREQSAPRFTEISKGIRPSEAEVQRNPRARSAVLRHAVRTDAPARKRDEG